VATRSNDLGRLFSEIEIDPRPTECSVPPFDQFGNRIIAGTRQRSALRITAVGDLLVELAAKCRTAPYAAISKNHLNNTWLTADSSAVMRNDPRAPIKPSEYETELKIAKGFDIICDPPGDAATERLNLLKGQILTLFLRLQRGDLCCTDAKAQLRCIQEELSRMIWAVDDWQIQFARRN